MIKRICPVMKGPCIREICAWFNDYSCIVWQTFNVSEITCNKIDDLPTKKKTEGERIEWDWEK